MILILLFIIIALSGFILMKSDIEDSDIYGVAISTSGFTLLIISLLMIFAMHAMADKDIQKNKIEYEGLCKRSEIIKSEYEDMSKSDVIRDITAWNIKVYNTKYWSENLWTNWFNPKKIADNLYYIPLEEERDDKE